MKARSKVDNSPQTRQAGSLNPKYIWRLPAQMLATIYRNHLARDRR
jgi:hypothetical protein